MRRTAQYKLFIMSLGFIAILLCSLLLPGIPITGYWQQTAPAADSFRFAFFVAQQGEVQINEWMTRLEKQHVSLFSAPDRLFDKRTALPMTRFFPVFDSTSAIGSFSDYYSYLPGDALPSFRRSVYTINYANAQFFFLNEEQLSKGDSAQLEWLERTAKEGGQIHRIVLLKRVPTKSSFWDALGRAGINLALTENEAYTPASVSMEKPSGYRAAGEPGWDVWRTADSPVKPLAFIVEARDHQLTLTLTDQEAAVVGIVREDVTNLRMAGKGLREGAYVSLGSLWRYHAGGSGIKAVVPKELDITGETPIRDRFTLPAEDWRSPEYDDASWPVGRAPFGYSQESAYARYIQTMLPNSNTSPTYYFRKTFIVEEDPVSLDDLKLHVTYEDGFIAYLNGSELYRDGMREGLVDDKSLASPSEAVMYRTYSLKNHRDSLVKGSNTITVEIHRSHPKTPNVLFDLSLSYVK